MKHFGRTNSGSAGVLRDSASPVSSVGPIPFLHHLLHGSVQGRVLAVLFAALIASLSALPGCSASEDNGSVAEDAVASEAEHGHVLIIGVDGLEWDLVLKLIRDGRMPHLEGLMRRGTFGMLETYAPAKSPVIWTTIATGKQPEKHGILDFVKPGKGGRQALYTSRDRKTKALWNILTDAGRRMTVIGWWNTFPVEEINGVIVSQANSLTQMRRTGLKKPAGMLGGVEDQVYPASRQNEMWEIVEQVDRELPSLLRGIFGQMTTPHSIVNEANWRASTWSVRADESYRRIALKLANENPLPDCFAVYFGAPDVVAHRFWRYHEPDVFTDMPTAGAIRRFGNVIKDSYVQADRIIGELVAAFPPDTSIFVMSDHGMHAFNQTSRFAQDGHGGSVASVSGHHQDGPPGVLVVAGPRFRKAALPRPIRELRKGDLLRAGHVLDIAPTILALLDIPVARDMDGVVLRNLLTPASVRGLDVTYVASHDSPKWFAQRGATEIATPGAEERVRQLKAIGYLDDSEGEDELATED